MPVTGSSASTSPQSNAVGHAEQPAAERRPPAHRAGLVEQHQEGGLEGVIDIGLIGQYLPARCPDARSMSPDQGSEGGVVALVEVVLQQLPVAQPPVVGRSA